MLSAQEINKQNNFMLYLSLFEFEKNKQRTKKFCKTQTTGKQFNTHQFHILQEYT
ncbi:unnamed protein product [Paramecium pentaurelia]|uniref:Uncharacterized protein n=1 Tax=Paramecium pentaurelia TaxID=43138 RepID=A0A8S1VFT8_9CILI|nr:unnamed protein product [Paramecium pentaurelia]